MSHEDVRAGAPAFETLAQAHCKSHRLADEIVGAARFLESDASAFKTGSDLLVDDDYNSI